MKRNANLKLKAAIVESGMTFENMANSINMPCTTFSRKVNGHAEFSESEIENICIILKKSPVDIFFYGYVTKCITNTA